MNYFIQLLGTDPLAYFVAFAAVAFGLVVHNIAQAFVAARLGDTDAQRQGFTTAEPRVHLDPMSLIFVAIFGIGFARLVPWRLSGMKAAQTAISGPIACILMAIVYIFASIFVSRAGPTFSSFATGFFTASYLMIIEATFQIFPIPPLDGARVVYALGSSEARRFMDQLQSYGPIGFILIFMVLSKTGIFAAVISVLASFAYRVTGLAF